jgi:hypothetical protein
MVVTQQYLVGELSLLLSNVAAVAVDQTDAIEVARLRREAETSPTGQLASIAARALHLMDTLCWASLSCGDVAAFQHQADVSSRLYEFCVCSGLLDEC